MSLDLPPRRLAMDRYCHSIGPFSKSHSLETHLCSHLDLDSTGPWQGGWEGRRDSWSELDGVVHRVSAFPAADRLSYFKCLQQHVGLQHDFCMILSQPCTESISSQAPPQSPDSELRAWGSFV